MSAAASVALDGTLKFGRIQYSTHSVIKFYSVYSEVIAERFVAF